MSARGIEEQYSERGSGLPGSRETDATRRAALARFGELGFPGRKLESWHYTELAALADKSLDYVGAAPEPELVAAAGAALAELGLDSDAPLCVFVDGHWAESLSSVTPTPALDIARLTEAPSLLLALGPEDSALAALNTAFAAGGASFRITGQLASPLQLVHVTARAGLAAQVRLRLELSPGSQASVIQHCIDLGTAGDSWLNLVTEVDQGEDSALTFCRLQQSGAREIHTALTRARLAAGASLTTTNVEVGGSLVRNDFEVELAGAAATATLRGFALTRDRQHCDMRIAIDHREPHTRSRQEYRAIASDRSRSVFNGKVTVRPNAQHIDAHQRNDNLLLSATAEIDTKPELEIYADQVVCSHGATVGELSEEHLFYLRSRGIDVAAARAILTTAFADVILDKLSHKGFREGARAAVTGRLPRSISIA